MCVNGEDDLFVGVFVLYVYDFFGFIVCFLVCIVVLCVVWCV